MKNNEYDSLIADIFSIIKECVFIPLYYSPLQFLVYLLLKIGEFDHELKSKVATRELLKTYPFFKIVVVVLWVVIIVSIVLFIEYLIR